MLLLIGERTKEFEEGELAAEERLEEAAWCAEVIELEAGVGLV